MLEQRVEVSAQCRAQICRSKIVISMRAAGRLLHNFIDHSQLEQILRGKLQRLGCFRRVKRCTSRFRIEVSWR